MTTEGNHAASPRARSTCPRCEQEGTCPMHLFERRAREAGQRDTRPPDEDREFITTSRAAQIRMEIEMEAAQVPPPPSRQPAAEEARWSVRGEPRTRERFAGPHPGDFPGGLPLPPECPVFP